VSLNNFIPTIWSARLLVNLYNDHVYGQAGVVNRDYEGEIQNLGDTVKIQAIGPVTISDYTKNTNLQDPQALDDSSMILTIEKSKSFNFAIDDVDKAQGNVNVMDGAMREAAYALGEVSDQYLAGMYTQVSANNTIGSDNSPVVPTANTAGSSAYEYLVDLGTLLTQSNVPKQGRWCIVPPWFHGLLQKDDRFVKQVTPVGTDVLLNGQVGRAAGFNILESNNVPNTNGAKYKIMAGHPMAISFAEQINKVEAYRPEKRFADAMKGLHLFGGKVVRPQGFAVLTASKS